MPGDPYADPVTGVLRNKLGLCEVHRKIFGDIYDWAGQARTVAIAKGTMCCLPQYIEPSAAEIFRQLRIEDFLRGLDRGPFIDRLTYYLGEVNAVHPFREGNGRTQRAFFEQLAGDAGFPLHRPHCKARSWCAMPRGTSAVLPAVRRPRCVLSATPSTAPIGVDGVADRGRPGHDQSHPHQ